MEKENQRVTLSKRLLAEGLMRLAKKKEIDKISVSELCKESGINRATFYRHYETPRDILVEMEKNLFDTMLKEIKFPKSVKDIERFLEEICRFFENRSDELRILILSNSDTLFVQVLYEIFMELWNRQPLDNLSLDSVKMMAVYSSGGSYFILRQWLLGEINTSPKEIAALAYRLLTNMDWPKALAQMSKMHIKMKKEGTL